MTYKYIESGPNAAIEAVSSDKGETTVIVCMWASLLVLEQAGRKEEVIAAMKAVVEVLNQA